MKIQLSVPSGFDFWKTVCSHGWCALPPYSADREMRALERPFELSGGRIVPVRLTQQKQGRLTLDLRETRSLGAGGRRELAALVRSCLRLDEEYGEFYALAGSRKEFRWIPAAGAGRMLRSPTVFEDVVKMICTTNCSWALTEIMVANLCKEFGTPAGNGSFTFPRPAVLARTTDAYLRKHVRSGYRSPYILELARRAASGELDPERWRSTPLSTALLFDEVRGVKGVGPYAAGNLLKLLGHYDHLGIDSWCRKRFFEIHRGGRMTTDKAIERFYRPLGKWRGLFFWLDVTKHWYEKEFPFHE